MNVNVGGLTKGGVLARRCGNLMEACPPSQAVDMTWVFTGFGLLIVAALVFTMRLSRKGWSVS
jgi:hypothetical protein